MKLQSIPLDVLKYVLSFANSTTVASFARTNKYCYVLTRKFYLDSVHHIGMIDCDGKYHIQHLSSKDKQSKSIDLTKMICIDTNNSSMQYLLQNSVNTDEYTWAKFISKQYRVPAWTGRDNISGYWKLFDAHKDIITDLNVIKSLVMHKEIAPKLLKYYSRNKNHFNVDKITIITSTNKYDIFFWNGASINQCNTFKIYDYRKKKQYYYMNFKSDIPNIKWMWYDNDASEFTEYCLGEKVKAQIECSYQSNLFHNFPLQFQKDGMFKNVNLPELKKGLIKRFGNDSRVHKNKLFALMFRIDTIDDPNSQITSMCQSSIALNDFSKFSRTIKRVDLNNSNESGGVGQNDFHLRMPSEIIF